MHRAKHRKSIWLCFKGSLSHRGTELLKGLGGPSTPPPPTPKFESCVCQALSRWEYILYTCVMCCTCTSSYRPLSYYCPFFCSTKLESICSIKSWASITFFEAWPTLMSPFFFFFSFFFFSFFLAFGPFVGLRGWSIPIFICRKKFHLNRK